MKIMNFIELSDSLVMAHFFASLRSNARSLYQVVLAGRQGVVGGQMQHATLVSTQCLTETTKRFRSGCAYSCVYFSCPRG